MGKRGVPSGAANAAEDLWGEAVRRWYAQESTELPPPDDANEFEAQRPFPPGWWILPALVLSLAFWAVIGWMALS